MTQNRDDVQKVAELNALFVGLNAKGKDSALTILRALNFAQAVIGSESNRVAEEANRRQIARA